MPPLIRKRQSHPLLPYYKNEIKDIFDWFENNFSYEIANKIFFKFGGFQGTPQAKLVRELIFNEYQSHHHIPSGTITLDETLHPKRKSVRYDYCSNHYFIAGKKARHKHELYYDIGEYFYELNDTNPRKQTYPEVMDIQDRCANWWYCKMRHNGNTLCCLAGKCNDKKCEKDLVCEFCRYNFPNCNTPNDKMTLKIMDRKQKDMKDYFNIPELENVSWNSYYEYINKNNQEEVDKLPPKNQIEIYKTMLSLKKVENNWKHTNIYMPRIEVENNKIKIDWFKCKWGNVNWIHKISYNFTMDERLILSKYNCWKWSEGGMVYMNKIKPTFSTYEKEKLFVDNVIRYLYDGHHQDLMCLDYTFVNTITDVFRYCDMDFFNYDLFKMIEWGNKLMCLHDDGSNFSNASAMRITLNSMCNGYNNPECSNKLYWFCRTYLFSNNRTPNKRSYCIRDNKYFKKHKKDIFEYRKQVYLLKEPKELKQFYIDNTKIKKN